MSPATIKEKQQTVDSTTTSVQDPQAVSKQQGRRRDVEKAEAAGCSRQESGF